MSMIARMVGQIMSAAPKHTSSGQSSEHLVLAALEIGGTLDDLARLAGVSAATAGKYVRQEVAAGRLDCGAVTRETQSGQFRRVLTYRSKQ